MKSKLLVSVIALSMLFIVSACEKKTEKAGCTDHKHHSASAHHAKAQTVCPVMGEKINKDLFVDVDGKRIYVCCDGCIAEVKADPAKYIKKIEEAGESVEVISAEKTSLKQQEFCPLMEGRKVKRDLYVDHKGQRIYVCCKGCLNEAQKDPEKVLQKLISQGQTPERI
ncbi:MAG: hypothetical protein GX089_11320 [Fibrobacter sp.]|jgi:YHS domain-containing protein|nr:hypothetical protein [Fibrobacter sp.]